MFRYSLLVSALFVIVMQPFGAMAQKDAKDHPLISRFQGSEVLEYKVFEFDQFPLALGAIEDTDKFAKAESLEGKVTKFKYSVPTNRSTLEIIRSYRDALQKSGFQILFACDGKACISDKFKPNYTMTASGIWCYNCEPPMRYVAAKLSRPTGDAYVSVLVEKDYAWLNVIEVKPMASGNVTVNAQALANDISTTGHAAIYGIYFDTGKASVKPESDPTIGEIAKLLGTNKDLRLHVIGHTDNVGAAIANMTLSKQRADAVVAVLLTKYGVPPARLQAAGVGPFAPVTTNRSDEGRARNRRVELVEQ
jgi:OOP family OmpA-OmpF porin